MGELTVKGDGEVATPVGNAMQTELIGHVCNLVFSICLLCDDLHWATLFSFFRKLIASLSQVAPENLHEAVGIAVVVNGTTLARAPDEDKLSRILC